MRKFSCLLPSSFPYFLSVVSSALFDSSWTLWFFNGGLRCRSQRRSWPSNDFHPSQLDRASRSDHYVVSSSCRLARGCKRCQSRPQVRHGMHFPNLYPFLSFSHMHSRLENMLPRRQPLLPYQTKGRGWSRINHHHRRMLVVALVVVTVVGGQSIQGMMLFTSAISMSLR